MRTVLIFILKLAKNKWLIKVYGIGLPRLG